MEDDFDVNAAVDDIGSGLGFDVPEEKDDDVVLEVEAKEVPDTPALATETPEVTSDTPAPAADAPPKTWRKEASAVWAGLPSEVKSEILKREEDIFKGIESYKAEATFGKSMKDVIIPYEPILRQFNINPVQQVASLMNAHYTLATGNEQTKIAMFQKIAQDYKVDLGSLSIGEPPYVDPAVSALQNELNSVKSQLSAAAQTRYQEQATANKKQVDAFAADTKNVYFNEVADDMAALLSKGVVGSLQEAYDKALWMNPSVRAKELARTTAESTQAAQAEAKAKADKAKAATAANVRARAKSGSAATPLGSLDDTLNEAFANIKSRG